MKLSNGIMKHGPKTQRVLDSLPATIGELAVTTESTRHRINAMLYWLKLRGMVRKTDRLLPNEGRGRDSHLWERMS